MEKLSELTQREFNTQETYQLLKASGSIMWSWGVSKLINYQNEGLLLKVNGHHHKGWVFITLAWNDTYSIHYLNNRYKVKESQTDIYCDMLTRTIDDKIERIDDYQY
ncbi:hypothetical protein [Leeuwenhoekiella sp. NPDC079379]|uniref:hypothetical protein n=1 Tax=Leeuwenhoekiella sp. NPDC079379 TaxID=3364122 RepID=UPI0037C50730